MRSRAPPFNLIPQHQLANVSNCHDRTPRQPATLPSRAVAWGVRGWPGPRQHGLVRPGDRPCVLRGPRHGPPARHFGCFERNAGGPSREAAALFRSHLLPPAGDSPSGARSVGPLARGRGQRQRGLHTPGRDRFRAPCGNPLAPASAPTATLRLPPSTSGSPVLVADILRAPPRPRPHRLDPVAMVAGSAGTRNIYDSAPTSPPRARRPTRATGFCPDETISLPRARWRSSRRSRRGTRTTS